MDEDVFWWHSIDLGDRVTPGQKTGDLLEREWSRLRLPDLTSLSVLDIGCWDGWFSFRAEREGAARVVALDHYVWSLDLPRQQAYWRDCRDRGVTPEPYHERPELWQPDTLPGKTAFDLAHKRLESRVEPVVGDFMTMDLGALGAFDVVIESAALVVGDAAEPLWQFVPGVELNADVGNCRPTGRRRVLPADGPCPRLTTSRRGRLRSSC